MISSIFEVQSMRLSKGSLEDDPIFKPYYMMTSPGCSVERISYLIKHFPRLPQTYIDILSSYSINTVEVDGFNLSPYFNSTPDTVGDFFEAYEDPFFPKEFMQKHKMYQIGSYNTDILCVTEGTEQFSEGEILYIDEGYDIYNPEDEQIHPLAKDFEQFLIIAGNLEELHTQMQGDDSLYDIIKTEFLDRLNQLGVDKKYHKMWLSFL